MTFWCVFSWINKLNAATSVGHNIDANQNVIPV
jgi:hypothetical protein